MRPPGSISVSRNDTAIARGPHRLPELGPRVLLITAAAFVGLIVKIVIDATTIGTNDVLTWERFLVEAHQFGGIGLYRMDPLFNHPPFIITFLHAVGRAARLTGLPFPFWLRLPAIAADLGSLVLVYVIGQREGLNLRTSSLVLLALAPASIMISGFHGNTDPVMIFFVLLSIYFLDRQSPWAAGLAAGMSLNIKVAAVIFLPAILFAFAGYRQRGKFLATAVLTVVVGSLPYLVENPLLIASHTLGYTSLAGHWGVTRLMSWLPAGYGHLEAAYIRWGGPVLLVAIAGIAWWLNRSSRRPRPFLQAGLSVFLFLGLTPGFGVQYLAWIVPWVVALGRVATLAVYAATGLFLFAVYTFWSQGFPWYLADSNVTGDWRGGVIVLELLAWLAIVVFSLPLWRRARWGLDSPSPRKSPSPARGGGSGWGL